MVIGTRLIEKFKIIQMKKILFLLFIISIIGCETNTIEIEKTSGEWFRGESKGKKYMLAGC